jgi:hypothetical protein
MTSLARNAAAWVKKPDTNPLRTRPGACPKARHDYSPGVTIELDWREDFGSAAVMRDGHFAGTLRPEWWWAEPSGEPLVAWVAACMDPTSKEMITVCVEVPAAAVGAEREAEMLEKARDAIDAGPPAVPGPATAPIAAKPSAEEVSEQLGRVIAAWVSSLDELWAVAEKRDPNPNYSLYFNLVHTLNWAYTVDQALQAGWNRVPTALQVPASQKTDAEIEAALEERRTRGVSEKALGEDPTFVPYFTRKAAKGRPYGDWASLVVAGAFHERFFEGLNWVSGKMRHNAAELPIELRQMRPGGEPRWKWKVADAIAAAEDKEKRGRASYERHLSEKDLLGLFSWLVDIYVEAEMLVVKLLREAEQAA